MNTHKAFFSALFILGTITLAPSLALASFFGNSSEGNNSSLFSVQPQSSSVAEPNTVFVQNTFSQNQNVTAANTNNTNTSAGDVTFTVQGNGCSSNLLSFDSQYDSNPANVPSRVGCQHVGQDWVGMIDYRAPNGACYHTDWTGTYQISCTATTPLLPNGVIPNLFDTSFDWAHANAKCYHTASDLTPFVYATSFEVFCGIAPHGASLAQNGPYSGNLGPQINTAPILGSNGSAIDQNSCDPTLMNATMSFMGTRNPVDPPYGLSCKTIGQAFVGSIDYRTSNNSCVHSDWTGTYSIACTASTPALPGGAIPSIYDTTFDWQSANAKCYYTLGDQVAGMYGMTHEVFCGVTPHGASLAQPVFGPSIFNSLSASNSGSFPVAATPMVNNFSTGSSVFAAPAPVANSNSVFSNTNFFQPVGTPVFFDPAPATAPQTVSHSFFGN